MSKKPLPNPKSAIAERLAMLRARSRLDQADVGRYVGRDQSAISLWEDPERKGMPTLRQLLALRELFGCSADSLISLTVPVDNGDPVEVVRERALGRRKPNPKRRDADSDEPPHAATN